MAGSASIFLSSRAKFSRASLTPEWRQSLIGLCASMLLVCVLFWPDWVDLASIAWNISTYNHILVVVPILGWLVAQRMSLLRQLTPRIWAPGLLVLAAAAIGWILGQVAGLAVARQLAIIMMIQGSVITIMGPTVSRGLIFPLGYGFFLLPIGEEIVPYLQTVTANMTMVLLEWTAIPAQIEGVFITTPTGYFEVAEACSGIEFLIAMIAFGTLAANICFRNWGRRILFMIMCIIVPIVANGIRAWGTIFIAHYHGIEFASGFDHVFYGWIFFAIVLALVIAIGWRFFDRSVDAPAFDLAAAKRHGTDGEPKHQGILLALACAILLASAIWSVASVQRPAAMPAGIDLPAVPGWTRVGYGPTYPWQPRFAGANHRLFGTYANDKGDEVEVGLGLYDRQEEGREVTGYRQGAYDPASDWAWTASGDPVDRGKSDILVAPGPVTREALTYYRVGPVMTGSASRVKLEIMKARMFGQSQPAMTLIISAENREGRTGRAAINAFVDDIGSPDKWADQIVSVR